MFATKEPSMLSYQEHQRELQIEKPFGIDRVPSDAQMREILDGIDIDPINDAFADLFWEVQRSGEWKKWLFDGEYFRGDGDTKNDCERNATGRLVKRVRRQHPKLKLLVIEDGLSSNAPHIAGLKSAKMHFMLDVNQDRGLVFIETDRRVDKSLLLFDVVEDSFELHLVVVGLLLTFRNNINGSTSGKMHLSIQTIGDEGAAPFC